MNGWLNLANEAVNAYYGTTLRKGIELAAKKTVNYVAGVGAPVRSTYRQVHLPKVMVRYARRRRYRRRSRRGGRRRFGRKRFSRRSSGSSRIGTTQHDVQRRYTAGRRRGTGFVRRVQSALVQLQPLGLYTYQFAQLVTGTANQSSLASVMAGGMTTSNYDELFQAMRSAYSGITVAADAKKYEIYIRSLVLDVQLTNAGSGPIVVEVYRLLCRRAYSSAVTPDSQLVTAWGELGSDATGGTITTTKPTLTPFDAPNFCEFWKILSKQQTILPAGNFITMQVRMKRTKKIEGKLFTTMPQAIPYYTQAYLFIVRGAPENNAGTARLAAPTFSVCSQWSVHLCGPPGNQAEFGRTA